MLGFRLSKRMAVVALVALPLVGCPDPDGAADEFLDRTEDNRKVPDAAPAVGFFDASGRYMLAIAASADPSRPVLTDAQVNIDVDAKTIQIELVALSVMGRMQVGDTLTHDPVPLSDDGEFEINYGEITIDGAADPLVPDAPIVATLIFKGKTNSEMEVCGAVDGQVTMPAMLPLTGSTFGVVPAEDGEFADLEAMGECSKQE